MCVCVCVYERDIHRSNCQSYYIYKQFRLSSTFLRSFIIISENAVFLNFTIINDALDDVDVSVEVHVIAVHT